MMRYGAVLILILGLVASAAGAGDTTPVLPHEFYGSVTIGGSPAPAGTVITAKIAGVGCGSVQMIEAGRYGSPDESLGSRLDVTATADRAGATITFYVNGVAAQETATFTSGAFTALDLTATAGESTPTPTPGNGGGSGSGGSSTSPGSQLTYDPNAPVAPIVSTERASLTTSAAGVVLTPVTVRTDDETGAVTIPEGTTALDGNGNPLGEVTCSEVAPAEVPPAPPGTTVAIALSCGPAGATFDPPAVLTYTLSAEEWARIGEGATPKVMWYNLQTGGWQEIAATMDPATRTVTAEVDHFSIYALAWTVPATTAVAAGAEGTRTPVGEPAGEPGPVLPLWVPALVVVLIATVAAFLVLRKK
ncbi:hypothetical protein F8E02_06885 [Methanoculleus sp. Wushi-C6]|uniref:PGF-pre-PGF domain-containing protein n=1 Tax=Methanoculleus caldifontis TaxID=2651577 RepID=A0ABU3X115_9EURY|nr:hypothetical protein [Methanoculleus sp. Wushi-C6]MDV2481735.1 hypothetical protein [Methanoculleus sp. Wushi-C6]